jgi:hypothetical protein
MTTTFVPTLDQAALTTGLRETCDRLRQLCQAAEDDLSVLESDVNWLEIHDLLDRIKDRSEQVIRPAPRSLVDVYVRTRTWLREIHPRLRNDPEDGYGRRQLATLIQRLGRELLQFSAI